jgi:hypothetical protein
LAGRVGYGVERDLACAFQGLRKVACQPLLVWFVPTFDRLSPFNELILGMGI